MDRHESARRDATDPLADRRAAFAIPEGVIYLDGNSLGALQPAVADRLREVVEEEWGHGLIRSWNDAGWLELPRRVATRLAPLVGAHADELAVTDSTSANLFKALAAAHRLRPERHVLLTDDGNFPTDVYVAHGLAELTGTLEVEVVPTDQLGSHLDERVAALMLTHVDYRTGRRYDAAALTAAAHAVGALAVWDLSHSTGALAVELGAWGADLAVGCTYKYTNGGPGAPAFLYVARRWHDLAATPVRGWFGHARPFAFDLGYVPAPGAERFLDGSPPVLSMAALETALEVFDGVSPHDLDARAQELTGLFIAEVDRLLGPEVEVVTPREASQRGAQVSLRHPDADAITEALLARGVIGDHRPPDLVRFGFAPLYVTRVEVLDAAEAVAEVITGHGEGRPGFRPQPTVT
ncbi:MAG: kynureninase [Nitriliruptoraceae bacterium]